MCNSRALKIVYFNAQGIENQWAMICAELQETDADIYCISESWITSSDDPTLYSFRNYLSFCNCRPDRSRGGVMLLINPKLQLVLCKQSPLMSTSTYYNICSVKLMNCSPVTTLAVSATRHACVGHC